jgi:hypothetical protein
LALAGERAVSLAANAEACRHFVPAADLADTPLQRAELEALELAKKRGDRVDGTMAVGHMIGSLFMLGEWDEARSLIPDLHVEFTDRPILDRVCHVAPLSRTWARSTRRAASSSSRKHSESPVRFRRARGLPDGACKW